MNITLPITRVYPIWSPNMNFIEKACMMLWHQLELEVY